MKRALALGLALGLILGTQTPALADGGPELANLIASATGVNRTYDATLANMAAIRTAEADFAHHELTELTGAGWSYGEVIGWNRYASDPYAWVVEGWMASPDHAVLLTDPFYTRIGCDHRAGVVTADGPDEDTDPDVWDYFVCLVGTPTVILPDTAMEP